MRPEIHDNLLTAFALGELNARENARVAAFVETDAEARQFVDEVRETASRVADELGLEHDGLTPFQHAVIEDRLVELERAAALAAASSNNNGSARPLRYAGHRGGGMRLRQWLPLAASLAASVAIVCGSLAVLIPWMYPQPALTRGDDARDAGFQIVGPGPDGSDLLPSILGTSGDSNAPDGGATNALLDGEFLSGNGDGNDFTDAEWNAAEVAPVAPPVGSGNAVARQDAAPGGPSVVPVAAGPPASPNPNSTETVASTVPPGATGDAEDVRPGGSNNRPTPPGSSGMRTGSSGSAYVPREGITVSPPNRDVFEDVSKLAATQPDPTRVYENPFRLATQRQRSAFPVRVETGSYKLVRDQLQQNLFPPAYQVRIEELVNRFRYAYVPPADDQGAVVTTVEIAACPWEVKHRLARVAIKAREGGATVVARDVEVSIEFNPVATFRWRLIGYESAPAAKPGEGATFATDLAAAGTATAFYEIIPASTATDPRVPTRSDLFTVNVRYRDPADGTLQTSSIPARDAGNGFDRASDDFKFASAVAAFGMLLRDSHFRGQATYGSVIRWAGEGKGADVTAERAAFIQLARLAHDASKRTRPAE